MSKYPDDYVLCFFLVPAPKHTIINSVYDIYIEIQIYDCRSKGPCQCRDCPLQKPPGFQHETPAKVFSEFDKGFFWAKDFNMRPPRKINVGFTKDSRKFFLMREEWPFAD
jgi:hypothetical protein